MKHLLRGHAVQVCLAWLAGRYLAFTLRTTRWTLEGMDHLAPHVAGAPMIVGFWHEFLPVMPGLLLLGRRLPGYRATAVHALVSQHRDGRLIGEILRQFEVIPVHGSTTRGGASGLRELVKLLRRGSMIAITPDGPRGPRRKAAEGIATLAALAGVPIIPCAAWTSFRIKLGSWDRMSVPLPFGRGVMICGTPIAVARDGASGGVAVITAALNAVADRAEQACHA